MVLPVVENYVRTSMLFALPDNEVASVTLHWQDIGGDFTPAQDYVDALHARYLAFWTALKANYSSETKFVGTRVAFMRQDHKTSLTIDKVEANQPGTSAGPNLPTEVAVCCTLKTNTASRKTRGRVFMPAPSVNQVTSKGRLTETLRNGFADQLRLAINPISTGGSTQRAVILSKTYGLLTPITSVSVGDVYDVQRRRRDAHVESRVSATLAP